MKNLPRDPKIYRRKSGSHRQRTAAGVICNFNKQEGYLDLLKKQNHKHKSEGAKSQLSQLFSAFESEIICPL
ncbi:hypothetical protein MKW98_017016 [Papaver atlanticum]|uniref:Uncharacterized protein n=1 Tax=Papaver atlanticum TaxID=357466 RepID=A0AAD4XZD3_9MAGN|nr:hypothetical protein MKW98_017016 [Papaver atlanticum]